MVNQHDSLSPRVQQLLPSLAATAANLNEVSNKLSQLIERIDGALRRLNLGVPAWVTLEGGGQTFTGAMSFWREELGYIRNGRKWGLTLRRTEGWEGQDELEETETWAFNDAPRPLRIKAITKIPELIEKLDREASEMAERVSSSIDETVPLVEAIEVSAGPQRSIRKKVGGQS